ncbi:MAG: hypothetical protein Alpg2KO_12030 [Alphaproteobacteria bacterium]
MEWLDKAMAVVGFDENLKERLRREHGIVMTSEELADKLGVKEWVVENGDKDGKFSRKDKVIRRPEGQKGTGYKTTVTWDAENEYGYNAMSVEVSGLSRYESGDYSDLEGWQQPSYNNPRAQYEYEQRRASGIVKPVPGSDDIAGVVANFKRVSEHPNMYTLDSITTYRMERTESAGPVKYKRDTVHFDGDDMQAQSDALDDMRTAMATSRANQDLPEKGLPFLGINPDLAPTAKAEEETPVMDRRRELTPQSSPMPGF